MASVGRFLAVAPAYRSKEAIPEVLLKTLSPESLPHGKAEQHMVGVYALGPDDLIDIPDQPLSIGLSLKPQWSPSVQWEQKGKCQEKEHWTWSQGPGCQCWLCYPGSCPRHDLPSWPQRSGL